jgi:probable DNA metabolism protein
MAWRDVVFQYDGSFEGFLCCVFDSYVYKEFPIAFYSDEEAFVLSFYSVRTVQTLPENAQRVYRSIVSRSSAAARLLRHAFLTCMEDKEIHLYRLIVKLLRQGAAFLRDLSDETLYPVASAVRHLNGEAHLLKGFVRFSELGGVLGSEIEPKNRVLPLLRSHFCARYREDQFFIYDRTHKEALFYARGKAVIRPLEDFQMAPPDEREANYRLLWKRFYDTIAIKERENPRLRQTHMPKRYWNTMTEFQNEDYFKAESSPAGAEVPAVPDGRSAPGIPQGSGPSAAGSDP